MTPKYAALLEKVYEIHDLNKATAVLSWDKEVNMPPAGLTAFGSGVASGLGLRQVNAAAYEGGRG